MQEKENKEKEILKLKDVWVGYGGHTILEGINLSLNTNDFLGIIGPNGGGKTTLLKVILGLIKPYQGKAVVFDRAPEDSRKLMGYVPQYSFFDREFPLSVWEMVLMGRIGKTGLFKRYSHEDADAAIDALQTVEMLDQKDGQIGKLSGGEIQRVLIARAITSNPLLLLLDEPLSSIDVRMELGIFELLKKLKEKMSIIMVSHDISVISTYVDKIACLNHKLFYHGSKEITADMLEAAYHCPVDLIAHGLPHRVLKRHKDD